MRRLIYIRYGTAGGFTLVELVVAIVIGAILVTVAMRAASPIADAARVEETKAEMQDIAFAIAGNPGLYNGSVRSDFGYVGDVGAMPPNLEALKSNPGGYSTWKGPYLGNRFSQIPDDYKTDAWGAAYTYSGVTLTSTGSSADIVKSVAPSTADLLYNQVSGLAVDNKQNAPGETYADSIAVRLLVPNGSGGTITKTAAPDASGYFSIDSVPIGNHELRVIYVPGDDTVLQYVSVSPSSRTNSQCTFRQTYFSGSSELTPVAGSDTVYGSPPCTDIKFWIANHTGAAITVSTIQVSWSPMTAYYAEIHVGSSEVFDMDGSPRGVNGTTYTLSSPQTIDVGATVRIRIEDFRASNSYGGGSPVSMSEASLTVRFSDGTIIAREMPPCP